MGFGSLAALSGVGDRLWPSVGPMAVTAAVAESQGAEWSGLVVGTGCKQQIGRSYTDGGRRDYFVIKIPHAGE